MYYPLQIPFMLNKEFTENVVYTETTAADLNGFGICFWDVESTTDEILSVTNVIVTDGCIDLVVSFDEQLIGFSGKSRTDFDYEITTPARYMGIRLMPGAFHQLTGRPADAAMDKFLPISRVFDDFDEAHFFSLPFDQARESFKEYLAGITKDKTPDGSTLLFHSLSENLPDSTNDLYGRLGLSPRQCQRIFKKHYGLTPKTVLSIIRFQNCLKLITSEKTTDMDNFRYYDQPHFINDFKRNIGITPFELIKLYS